MSDLSIEYSLNTPIFQNTNILDKKLLNLIKYDMQGGGIGLETYNCITIIIGIIIIIIGFILLWFKNNLVEIDAIIKTQSYDKNEYKINITYNVNSIQYSKIITMEENPNTSTIKIYYQKSNPNSIQLYNQNYNVIGIGMIIVGIFIMFFSIKKNNIFL